MNETEKTCGNCLWLCKEDGEPFYCLLRDLYTFREVTDEACREWSERDNEVHARKRLPES